MTVSRKQIRTGDYPPEPRARLGDAVAKARTAAGWQYRTDLVKAAEAAGEKLSIRSLQALETGDASVGQSALFTVARMLPGWTEDTPRHILEGGEPPATSDQRPPTSPAPVRHEFSADLRARWRRMTVDEILERGAEEGERFGLPARVRYLRAALQEKEDQLSVEDIPQ
ncbi:hypothetical protein VA596_41390 [Amycolatopsis sp., V23-08]|uniref:Helix-turn-helix transcriptional regulator n=1 Tax=Amycolatopsis heterodermiae TaxID=3110235 RepID=A0ABU5RID9_9PSEU|nr:hypothetical protein [Amycolatopsis sp., V23-08]MEA5366041.1 hypothetical protein [Amycolatopsis sp., V23-08]